MITCLINYINAGGPRIAYAVFILGPYNFDCYYEKSSRKVKF